MVISHQRYVLKKLASLSSQDLSMLKEAFAENKHPRFMKEFSFHDPYGKTKSYKKAVETADEDTPMAMLAGLVSYAMADTKEFQNQLSMSYKRRCE